MKRREFLQLSAGSAIATAAGVVTGAAQPALAPSALAQIKHVVVLMMENRSFDNLLGKLYPRSEIFDGLSGGEFNLDSAGNRVLVNNLAGTGADVMTTPNPNPGESWADINEQLFGRRDAPASDSMPDMSGFVRNYLSQSRRPRDRYDPKRIMHHFTPEQVPVISQLARQFAVSDRWFASAPTQTWPNRFFLHCATANGYENNLPAHFPYKMTSIFDRLHAKDPTNGWRIYSNDIPHALTLANLWKQRRHFSRFSTFLEHARQGALPSYAFIEPDYFPFLGSQSDEHPPTSVAAGEGLIASVYNALRQGPAWTSTLLVILFDEHGGCYDHVPPPLALPPSGSATSPFNFDRFGVRVPAVFVSPYIQPGQVLRPAGVTPFDHTSVIATLRKRFDLGPPLTDRDAAAPSFEAVLNLSEPTNLGPERIEAPPVERRARSASAQDATADQSPLTDLQESLHGLSEVLPNPGQEEAQIRRLEASPRAARAPGALRIQGLTPETAGATANANMKRFRGEV